VNSGGQPHIESIIYTRSVFTVTKAGNISESHEDMLVLFPALLLKETGNENHVDGAAMSSGGGLSLR